MAMPTLLCCGDAPLPSRGRPQSTAAALRGQARWLQATRSRRAFFMRPSARPPACLVDFFFAPRGRLQFWRSPRFSLSASVFFSPCFGAASPAARDRACARRRSLHPPTLTFLIPFVSFVSPLVRCPIQKKRDKKAQIAHARWPNSYSTDLVTLRAGRSFFSCFRLSFHQPAPCGAMATIPPPPVRLIVPNKQTKKQKIKTQPQSAVLPLFFLNPLPFSLLCAL